jgi:hypothetical protein
MDFHPMMRWWGSSDFADVCVRSVHTAGVRHKGQPVPTLVTVIYGHLADGASVEDSARLANRVTGKLREVDVILRSRTAGHESVIAVEAA